MHHIKSKARQAAWRYKHGEDPPATRFSSFRSSSKSSKIVRDGEPNAAPSRGLSASNPRDFAEGDAPPMDYTLSPQQTQNANGSDAGKILQSDSPASAEGNATALANEKHGVSDEYHSIGNSGTSPAAKARRRDRFTGMFKKKQPVDDPERQRTLTSESKKKKQHFTLWGQVKVVIFGSWVNVLLICVPVGIALKKAEVNPYAVFAVNFLAIVPLAGILSYATEEIAMRVGETLGGLLNASFGNAVELIVSIIALTQGQIVIVQTSLIGSILSNLLLVLGMCFFFGGLKRIEQFFNVTVAQTAASLLSLAVGSLLIPTCFHRFGTGGTLEQRAAQIPKLSRGTAIILLFVYGAYLLFQLKSHSEMFSDTGGPGTTRKPSKGDAGSFHQAIGVIGANQAAHAGGTISQQVFNPNAHQEQQAREAEEEEEEEEEQPQLSVIGAVFTLCAATAFVGVNSEYMVDGVKPLSEVISPEFIGLILIPIVGNAAEHATAVTVAIKDKMDLAIGVAVGSSMQIALLILPLVVIIGWIIGNDQMTLEFDGFLLTLVFVAVLLVNYLIGDGRSHWLEGVMLMMLYVIIAVAAYLYPADPSVVG